MTQFQLNNIKPYMSLNNQTQTLLKRIQEQQDIIRKMKLEEEKLTNHIRDFKSAIEKKTNASIIENKSEADTEKTAIQLEKQVQNANSMLKNYQNELANLQKKNKNVRSQDLDALQQSLRQKQNQVRKLKEEIKDLQSVKRKQEKVIGKKAKEEDTGKLTRMIEDVRKNKEILESVKAKHKAQIEIVQKKRLALKEIQEKYFARCKQNGENIITFEQFKEKRKEKGKEDQSVSRTKMKKIVPATVRQIITSQLTFDGLEYTEKGVRQLQAKKQIAETSLRNAKKKHEKQIEELSKKLLDLQKENENLSIRLTQKTKQRQIAELSSTQNMRSVPVKTARKLTPLK